MTLKELLATEVREEDVLDWLGVVPANEKIVELRGILSGLKAYMERYGEKCLI